MRSTRFADASVKRHGWTDVLVVGGYILAAIYVTFPLWVEPWTRVPPLAGSDQALFQWFLAHAAKSVAHFQNPLFTTLLNAPDGINMMANTSILGLGVPMTPITLQFGPHVSLSVLLTLALAGTAGGWYYVLSRHVVTSTLASAVGGWFCGFAPAMISHASWHPNMTFQLLVPFIVLQVMRLREPGRVWRNGIILALLVVYQAFISEEILLFVAASCAVFVVIYSVQQRHELSKAWRPMLGSLSVTAIVASALLAYPLWVQYWGPNHYRGLSVGHGLLTNDLTSFAAFATESLAGSGQWVTRTFLTIPSEENLFFGWPMLIVGVAAFFLSGRRPIARALRPTLLVFAVLGLGAQITFRGVKTGISGPWGTLEDLPVLDSVLASRFGLVVTAALGVFLAMATQQVWDVAARRLRSNRVRASWVVALVCALVPAAPTPLDAKSQPPIPQFFANGSWRSYLGEGETVVPLPFPVVGKSEGIRWAAASDLHFGIPNGYFLFPRDGVAGNEAAFGSPLRPTAKLLDQVEITGVPLPVTEADRRAAEADLHFWHASILVLPTGERNAIALRATVESLLGPAAPVQDVWLWKVPDRVQNTGGLL